MNADIAYIMSCSDDEFQQVTGIRLPEDAWDRWSDDMDKRTDELLALFEKAIAAEREACIEACWKPELNDWEGRAACIAAIRARSNT